MPEAVTRSDTYDLDVKLFNLKEELIEHIHNLHSDMVQQFYMQHVRSILLLLLIRHVS